MGNFDFGDDDANKGILIEGIEDATELMTGSPDLSKGEAINDNRGEKGNPDNGVKRDQTQVVPFGANPAPKLHDQIRH